jgi:hypothetical protein
VKAVVGRAFGPIDLAKVHAEALRWLRAREIAHVRKVA